MKTRLPAPRPSLTIAEVFERPAHELAKLFGVALVDIDLALADLWPVQTSRYIRVNEKGEVKLWLRPGLAGADRDEAIKCAVREYLGLGPAK